RENMNTEASRKAEIIGTDTRSINEDIVEGASGTVVIASGSRTGRHGNQSADHTLRSGAKAGNVEVVGHRYTGALVSLGSAGHCHCAADQWRPRDARCCKVERQGARQHLAAGCL